LGNIWISLFLLVAGACIVEAVRYAVEYIKRITPRVEFRVSPGIPVKVEDKHFCAYELKITNPSRKKIEDVTVHVRSRNDNLKLAVISKPDGFEYNSIDTESGVDFRFARLKQSEEVVIKVQVESKYYFSDSLGVTISSPNDIEQKRVVDAGQTRVSPFRAGFVFILGAVLSPAVIYIVALINANRPEQMPPSFEMDRRDVVISAAAVAGLPHIAELYFNANDPKYFDEGDIAYSLAVNSDKPDEVEKYRRLLSLTLATGPGMAPESQANLFYSLGKLDLLLSDQKSALSDFRNAIGKSRSIVEAQFKADTRTRNYLVEHGLL
jgi:hypothetical protein